MGKKRTRAERKADNIAKETQRRINAGDTSNYVKKQIAKNPGKFKNTGRVTQKDSRASGVKSTTKLDKSTEKIKSDLDELLKKANKKDIITTVKDKIMGGTPTGDPAAQTKKDWIDAEMVVPGEHKFRTEYNRLKAKYGDAWTKTGQAKDLLGYLAGVPTEKGGLLGGRDPEYGGGRAEYDTHGVFITEARRKELEAERQRLLDEIIAGGDLSSILEGITREGTGADLTPDQFYNFTQQLMAADPSYGNLEYKKARPLSSGAGIAAIGKALVSPYSTAATGILEALGGDKKKYGVGTGANIGIQGTGDYLKVEKSGPGDASFPIPRDTELWDIPSEYDYGFKLASGETPRYGPYRFPMHEMVAEGEELSFPIYGQKEKRPEYTGEPLDPALLHALKERGEILDPFARDESTHELAYDTRGGGITILPVDETPGTTPGTTPEDQWTTADAGKIGFYNPETGQYEYGTMPDYLRFAQVKDGGIIGMDDGGYLDDYKAADSLMFRDPQEDEEWEYNV
jgi:hypothetical protein